MIEKLFEGVRRPFIHNGSALEVSPSVGISIHPRDADSPEALTARADKAMYAAKAAGGSCFRFFGDA